MPGEPRIVLRWRVITRLRPGASIARAQSQADAAAAHSRSITPTYQGADLHFRLEPMQPYLTSQARPASRKSFAAGAASRRTRRKPGALIRRKVHPRAAA